MTKKDYVKIAGVIKKSTDNYRTIGPWDEEYRIYRAISDLAQDLAVVFLEDNPRFDQDRFLEACGL